MAEHERVARYLVNSGLDHLDHERRPQATAALKQAVDVWPSCAEAWHGLARALDASREAAEALAAYKRALSLDDTVAEAWHALGVLQDVAGEVELAAHCFEAAAELTPGWDVPKKALEVLQVRYYTLLPHPTASSH